GYLNSDEMPEALRAELDKWDTDKNGLIDLNEFKAYFQARAQQFLADRNAAGWGGWGGGYSDPGQGEPAPQEGRKAPVAYPVGELPKELPVWFTQLDTDGDAQIGLYEWKAAGRSIKEFQEIDRNGDGFLTVDEVLRYEKLNGSGGTAVAGGGSGFSPGSGFRRAGGAAPNTAGFCAGRAKAGAPLRVPRGRPGRRRRRQTPAHR